MRDLVFKNLTSTDKRRKVIASSEITDKAGVRSTIHRHFVCVVREIDQGPVNRPKPYLYVLKVRNNKEQKEKFFCRIKGVIFAINNSKLYEILFMHSLKICL
ncbi:MAG: hypothetical protein NTY47_03015, partial [Candidatus Omnitrophica bacterium]|nr:hypothetical protein [Candidatus Omnitrophota bacterium]